MSAVTDLRDYVIDRFRSHSVVELSNYDDQSAVTPNTSRIDTIAEVAINEFEFLFMPYDGASYPYHKEIASWLVLALLADDANSSLSEEYRNRAKERMEEWKTRRRVAPITSSRYNRSPAPTGTPPFDDTEFAGWMPK